ncbi:helix-turn-helix domain-containing protein, partial [Loktanella sp. DJP18]|uniref:helix-turn-helix domain-containing protein n=1 Tax=Loktanella sp. DJP18 TaxID=3409788 RepID=UPI003BB59AAA
RDWVMRFNARGPDALIDGKPPGPRSKLNDAQRQALVEIVESGPIQRVPPDVGAGNRGDPAGLTRK